MNYNVIGKEIIKENITLYRSERELMRPELYIILSLLIPTTKLKLKGAIFFCGGKGKPDDFFAEST